MKKRSRQGCPTEREAYKLKGFPGTEVLKVALEPGGRSEWYDSVEIHIRAW